MATSSITEANVPRSFGAFYPTGHIVIFFTNKGDAERAREAVLTGGYEENEIVALNSDYVVSSIEELLPHVSLLAQIGSEKYHRLAIEHLEAS